MSQVVHTIGCLPLTTAITRVAAVNIITIKNLPKQAKEAREKERLQFNTDLAKAGNFFSKAILEAFSKNGNLNVNARDDGEGYH